MGLNWYNKFLKRNIGLQINDITGIYSKVITDSSLNSNKTLVSMSESFASEDEFEPLRYLSVFFPDTKKEQILARESIRTRIQESSDILIPIITVTLTIITTFFLPKPS
jgi:hypothetical protein